MTLTYFYDVRIRATGKVVKAVFVYRKGRAVWRTKGTWYRRPRHYDMNEVILA